jgi:hypothetical protein
MIEIPISSLKEHCTDITQLEEDSLDDILDLLGKYDADFDCNQLVCSLLDQVCQDLEEELQHYQALEDHLDIDFAVLHADFDWDDAIFETIPEEEQRDGMSQIKESLVSLQQSLNVGEELRRKFDLRPCSVVLDRLDLSVTIETEAKIQRKRQRTEDAEWNPPAAKRSRRETSVVVPRRSSRNISKIPLYVF